jgi:hypothetical protein
MENPLLHDRIPFVYIIIYKTMGLTFQHILKTLQHISLFNTFFNQNTKKKKRHKLAYDVSWPFQTILII